MDRALEQAHANVGDERSLAEDMPTKCIPIEPEKLDSRTRDWRAAFSSQLLACSSGWVRHLLTLRIGAKGGRFGWIVAAPRQASPVALDRTIYRMTKDLSWTPEETP